MIDKSHPEWPGIRTWLKEQIETRRDQLESPDCLIKDAEHIRGRIMAYREIIDTVEPPQVPFVPEPAQDKHSNY